MLLDWEINVIVIVSRVTLISIEGSTELVNISYVLQQGPTNILTSPKFWGRNSSSHTLSVLEIRFVSNLFYYVQQ